MKLRTRCFYPKNKSNKLTFLTNVLHRFYLFQFMYVNPTEWAISYFSTIPNNQISTING